ncbi:hypothetical protein, partial [Caldibacillus thermoamylovorans]|uniref:hypothetical protein n=1 Tax=Caldibacillus thermoamylovorans TaxID=35841 RepID=UPI001E57BC49
RESPFFGDETFSRRHFCAKNSTFWRRDRFSSSLLGGNATFWRRDHFSSSLLGGKLHFLATRLFLVVTFARESPFFGDETLSRRHFCAGKSIFWRRDHFSSSLLGEKLHFLATRLLLIVIFGRETPFFGDETSSRRHFYAGKSIIWRRDSFSSSLLLVKLHFLTTRLFLVVILNRKMPLFSDETSSRHHFEAGNFIFL